MRASCRSGFPLIVFPNSSTTAVGNIEKGGHIDRSVSRKTKPNPHAPPLLHPVFTFSTLGPPFISHRFGSVRPFLKKTSSIISHPPGGAYRTVPRFLSLAPAQSSRPGRSFRPVCAFRRLEGRQHLGGLHFEIVALWLRPRAVGRFTHPSRVSIGKDSGPCIAPVPWLLCSPVCRGCRISLCAVVAESQQQPTTTRRPAGPGNDTCETFANARTPALASRCPLRPPPPQRLAELPLARPWMRAHASTQSARLVRFSANIACTSRFNLPSQSSAHLR